MNYDHKVCLHFFKTTIAIFSSISFIFSIYRSVALLAEMPGTGAVYPFPKIESVLLYRYESAYDYFIICCEVRASSYRYHNNDTNWKLHRTLEVISLIHFVICNLNHSSLLTEADKSSQQADIAPIFTSSEFGCLPSATT